MRPTVLDGSGRSVVGGVAIAAKSKCLVEMGDGKRNAD